jgi:hypothetical protein
MAATHDAGLLAERVRCYLRILPCPDGTRARKATTPELHGLGSRGMAHLDYFRFAE